MTSRIRTGSRFKLFPCFLLIDVRCLRVLLEVRVLQVQATVLDCSDYLGNVSACTKGNEWQLCN
jgi:hypothetical protein